MNKGKISNLQINNNCKWNFHPIRAFHTNDQPEINSTPNVERNKRNEEKNQVLFSQKTMDSIKEMIARLTDMN